MLQKVQLGHLNLSKTLKKKSEGTKGGPLAREASVSYGTMQNVLKKDLKVSPYKKCKAQLLSEATKAKQMSRAKLLLRELNDGMHLPVLWTDEKLFTVQAVHNHQND